jgi:O-antigen ligase
MRADRAVALWGDRLRQDEQAPTALGDRERQIASGGPAPVVALSITILLALSSVVMVEPAPSDILFPAVFALTLITGHMVSPLRLPGIFLASIGILSLASYASLLSAWAWNLRYSWFYLCVTFYMLAYFVFFAGFVGKFGGRAALILRDGYLWAATITAAIGLLAATHILPNSEMFFRDASLLRIQSTFKDPNVFGPFLVGAIFLGLSALAHGERVKLRYLFVVTLSLVGVTLSFSRGAYVHLLVSLVAYFLMEFVVVGMPRASRRLAGGLILLSPLLIAGLVFLLVSTDLGPYLVERLSYQAYDSARFGNQLLSLELIEHSFFGIGPGQYTSPRFTLDLHNLYLRVLVENGVIGLMALLTLLGASLFYGFAGVLRKGPQVGMYTACVAVILGILVESMVIDTLHWRHFFFFLSIPVGLTLFERGVRPEAAPAAPALPY